MMFDVEYLVKRTHRTPCCTNTYYVWESKQVDAISGEEAMRMVKEEYDAEEVKLR